MSKTIEIISVHKGKVNLTVKGEPRTVVFESKKLDNKIEVGVALCDHDEAAIFLNLPGRDYWKTGVIEVDTSEADAAAAEAAARVIAAEIEAAEAEAAAKAKSDADEAAAAKTAEAESAAAEAAAEAEAEAESAAAEAADLAAAEANQAAAEVPAPETTGKPELSRETYDACANRNSLKPMLARCTDKALISALAVYEAGKEDPREKYLADLNGRLAELA